MRDVRSTDGKYIPARFKKRELRGSKGGTVAVAAVATSLFVGPFALLWGLKKGRPAIIPAGNRYTVFVDGDMTGDGESYDHRAAKLDARQSSSIEGDLSRVALSFG